MGLGLEGIGNLADLLANKQGPMEIPLELIDEDPNQPRQVFDQDKLEELAVTIKTRGIKTPISVRNSEKEGRFIVNHGARRLRASKIAGKSTIPGFLDNDYNAEDQLIENIQRDNLTPREVAEFISKRLKAGMKKNEIAKTIGKSPAYITQHVNLLDLPDPIAKAFNAGRSLDVTVIQELVTAYKTNPEEVVQWLADESQEINRSSVRMLREYIAELAQNEGRETSASQEGQEPGQPQEGQGSGSTEEPEPKDKPAAQKKEKDTQGGDPDKLKKAIVQIEVFGRAGQLVLNKRPSGHGQAWIKYEDDGEEVEISLEQVKIVAIIEG